MTLQRTIGADVDSVWSVLSNIGRTADYNPVVYQSQGADNAELGATRKCQIDAAGRKWIEEQVMASGDHSYTIEIVGGNGAPPMRTTVDISAAATGDNETEVTMIANLHPETFVQNLMTIPAKGMMTKVLGRVLDGLDHHVATGELIGADFKAT